MRKEILTTMMVLGLVAAPAWSDETGRASKHEAAGVGGGAVIGAAVGGPVGAIIGAAFGGWFGDRYHQERTAHLEYAQRHRDAVAEAEDLEVLWKQSEERIARLESEIAREELAYRSALQEALNTQIFFHTGESEIHEQSEQSLQRMARLINELEGFVISVEGHADGRGDEEYNEQLSAERAASVRDVLVGAGVPSSRISLSAAGESQSRAAEADLDALALERRVHIELVSMDGTRRVAQQ